MLILTLALALAAGQSGGADALTGIVRDATGHLVSGATVLVQAAGGIEARAVTGADGRFRLPLAVPPPATLVVRAPGFEEVRRDLTQGTSAERLEIVLSPAVVSESVVVTAYGVPQRLQDVAASVNSLSREDIRRSAAVVADDVLRQVPTFSLFRRTSSLAAHPTAQGVSLRGLGPSGVSRTLVLLDGVPFNDPFGGWVYWTRLPMAATDRIEVVDSSSASLYGNYAMGGVINVTTRPALRRRLEADVQYGTRNSPKVEAVGSDVWGRFGLVADAAAFSTDGYPIVVATNPAGQPERGLVDKNASVSFNTFNLKGEYRTGRVLAFGRAGHFREERVNGKFSTIDRRDEANDTRWTSVSAGVHAALAGGTLEATAFAENGRFRSNFLAVPAANPPRSIGRMTLNQVVPSTSFGGSADWSLPFANLKGTLKTGADWRWVDGDSEEDGLDPVTGTQVTLRRISGGTQQSAGAYAQALLQPRDAVTLTLGARVDHWRNYDAHNLEQAVPSGTPTAGHRPSLPEREDTVLSPRVSARVRVTPAISVWGGIGAGFRAPTLNELYRQFRVGAVLTLANDHLGPERLVGGEGGVHWALAPNVMLRSTYFHNRVEDPVSNVTIQVAGAAVTQQRQNLGRTRIMGLQHDGELRVGASWRVTGGYLYERAEVMAFPANPALVGNSLPQVPRHRGSLGVAYANPRHATVALTVQTIGRQFDDDQNVRTVPGLTAPGLPRYTVFSLTAARAIGRNVEAFAGVQNLLDEQYFVGTLPTTVGTPRHVTVGVRVRFEGDRR